MKDIRKAIEDSLKKTKNITYNKYRFFWFKWSKSESIESIYGRLITQTSNCNLGDEETTLIRDTFTLNGFNKETEIILKQKALKIAINMEMSAQNQQKRKRDWRISQSNKKVSNNQSNNRISNFYLNDKSSILLQTLLIRFVLQVSSTFVVDVEITSTYKTAQQENAKILEVYIFLQNL